MWPCGRCSAQRLAASIEREARDKAADIIAEAEAQALSIRSESAAAIAGEEQRLAAAKRTSAKFIESMNAICAKQTAFLQKISEMDFVKSAVAESAPAVPAEEPAPAAEVHETVKSIEETVNKVADVPEQTILPDIPAPQKAIDVEPTKNYSPVSGEGAQYAFESFVDEE